MPTYGIVILFVVLFVLIVDPYIALWQAMHSISDKIDNLALSIKMLEPQLEALKVSDVSGKASFYNAQSDLEMAKTDLALARADLAAKQRHAANVAVEDGLQRALAVRQFIAKVTAIKA